MSDVSRGNPLWDFSLSIYSSKEVQAACLALQDGDGVDVNVLLFVLYLASIGRRIDVADVRRVLAVVEPWRVDVVVPLRTARRNLKTPASGIAPEGAEALRSIVKKAELEAERLQQTALHRLSLDATLGKPEPQPASAAAIDACAAANVAAYGAALGRQLANGPVGVMLAAVSSRIRPR